MECEITVIWKEEQELSSSWDWRLFGHIRHGPKSGWGTLCPFLEGELGTHLTQCRLDRGLPPFSFIQPFGHSTPTSQADRTDRTDNGPL